MSPGGQSVIAASVVGLFLALLLKFCNSESFIEILDVRTNSDRAYLTSSVNILNRSSFNINLTIHQILVGHNLYLSVNLKTEVDNQMVSLKCWRNIDLCGFLNGEKRDPILDFMFENAIQNKFNLSCPFKAGSYSLNYKALEASKIPPIIPKTKYRVFLEISQMIGDAVKLFSIKIDAVYRPG